MIFTDVVSNVVLYANGENSCHNHVESVLNVYLTNTDSMSTVFLNKHCMLWRTEHLK